MRVLVTGAASGIGRATCLRLGRDARARDQEAKVAAVDLVPSADLDELIEELRALGAEALPLHGDMGTVDAPARVVAEAVDRFGGLDGLVSNAGINRPGPLVGYSVEDWDRLFAVNTRATWLLAKAAHTALTDSRGAIVAVGSMSGTNPHAGLGAYGPRRTRPSAETTMPVPTVEPREMCASQGRALSTTSASESVGTMTTVGEGAAWVGGVVGAAVGATAAAA
jgi:NAD(P)-dependent dehydrogenase (short-subunit alcohol dehydrogenase family)